MVAMKKGVAKVDPLVLHHAAQLVVTVEDLTNHVEVLCRYPGCRSVLYFPLCDLKGLARLGEAMGWRRDFNRSGLVCHLHPAGSA